MPELPDLEAVKDFLNARLPGRSVERVAVYLPTPLRAPTSDFAERLAGRVFEPCWRRDQFLLFPFSGGPILAINPMIAGRFQYCSTSERRRPRTVFALSLADGCDLRYIDQRQMGKVYLIDDVATVPGFDGLGPEPFDPSLTIDAFRRRLRRHPGMIKGILSNETFVAGIGNAYADEILFAAGVHPYRKRATLSDAEIEALYAAMRDVLATATATIKERLGERPEVEIRDFLVVHGRGGQPCPRCGGAISQITARQRLTNFCLRCQH